MPNIKIKIDGKEISCLSDKTIMQVARDNGIEIPGLCQHPDFPSAANCRVCVVEIKSKSGLVTSCSTKVEAGMEILTNSTQVKKSRNLNIELIFAEHVEKCPTCIWRVNCQLLNLADKYKIEITRFPDRKSKRITYKFANAVEIDGSQCIDCRNCLAACNDMQKINYLKLVGKGVNQEVVPVSENGITGKFKKAKSDCIYCGQCAVHCPVGSAQEQSHWHLVEKVLKDKNKIKVVQFAPSVRVSIGEEFGLDYGKVMTGQVAAGLKQLGFDYVFDVNFGADITTIVEAYELLERIKNKKHLPMFTSCCPSWIKYVEFFRPDLIPNLTNSRSPQLHSAGVIKTFWANNLKINAKNITLVSVMPCTAKKFESARPELKVKGLEPVDYVITTRELAWLFKKNKINFARLKPKLADNPFGKSSGAGAIYGASGGVMESALRTAQYLTQTTRNIICSDPKTKIRGSICNSRIEFNDVRGLTDVKEAIIDFGAKKLRVAVVNGIGNIASVLENLHKYDYIEVMACPGGCIGGGGQPIPTTAEIRKKRLEALYKVDRSSQIRRAHENLPAIEAMAWLKNQGKLEQEVLYTKYKKRS